MSQNDEKYGVCSVAYTIESVSNRLKWVNFIKFLSKCALLSPGRLSGLKYNKKIGIFRPFDDRFSKENETFLKCLYFPAILGCIPNMD